MKGEFLPLKVVIVSWWNKIWWKVHCDSLHSLTAFQGILRLLIYNNYSSLSLARKGYSNCIYILFFSSAIFIWVKEGSSSPQVYELKKSWYKRERGTLVLILNAIRILGLLSQLSGIPVKKEKVYWIWLLRSAADRVAIFLSPPTALCWYIYPCSFSIKWETEF